MLPVVVRTMDVSDSGGVSALMPDLGYQAEPAAVEKRIALVSARADHAMFVAVEQQLIVGWIHVHGVFLLESDGYAEVGGLVVAMDRRRRGIGSALVRESERWAARQGFMRVRLRSGVHREAAHQFYEARGYSKAKASYAFERQLGIAFTGT